MSLGEISVQIQMKTTKRSVLILFTCLLLWLIGVAFLYYQVNTDVNKSFTADIKGGIATKDVQITLEDSKFWFNNFGEEYQSVGAQYDGVITNLSKKAISSWELVAPLSETGFIDSSWNGDITLTEDELNVVPDEKTASILPGESKSFGFVMISANIVEFEDFKLTGHHEVKYTGYLLFWILLVVAIAWIAFLIAVIIVDIKIKYFREQKENDIRIISQTMKTFAEMIDAKDPYTKGHSMRVAYYAKEIGRRLNMSEEECSKLSYIALMHDCGKMGVPDLVLNKPGRLDSDERRAIEEHTVIGGKMLINYTAIEGIKEGALYHHERFDGTGYPQGIKGKAIPLYGRIIGVADAFDAMNSDRCYRKHLTKDAILAELRKHSGTQFDPDIVKHMIDMIEEGYCDNKELAEL